MSQRQHPSAAVKPTGKAPVAAPVHQDVIEHAKEIMDQLIPLRRGMTASGIAAEAFELARAFATEAAKDAKQEHKTGESGHV